MTKRETNPKAGLQAVTVGEGTSWERQRVQSPSPEALAAREQVQQGAELTRVLSRTDQAADGAQPWSLTPREFIDGMGAAKFNQTYGVAGQTGKTAPPLDPPVVLTGRMPDGGSFVTTQALKEYGSNEKLAAMEVVAARDTVMTTGAYDLSSNATFGSLYPPELKSLQASGTLPQHTTPGTESPQSNTNQQQQQATSMPPISNQQKSRSELTPEHAGSSMGNSSTPPPTPPDLSQASFSSGPQQIRDDFVKESPQPSSLAREMALAHGLSRQPASGPSLCKDLDSPSR